MCGHARDERNRCTHAGSHARACTHPLALRPKKGSEALSAATARRRKLRSRRNQNKPQARHAKQGTANMHAHWTQGPGEVNYMRAALSQSCLARRTRQWAHASDSRASHRRPNHADVRLPSKTSARTSSRARRQTHLRKRSETVANFRARLQAQSVRDQMATLATYWRLPRPCDGLTSPAYRK